MDFHNYLKTVAKEINQELDSFLKKWGEEVESVSSILIGLSNTFIQANEGGKRLRGALVKMGYELARGTPTSEILKPAAAFEIFQTAILAHDDIVDLSPTRRGKPTIYKILGGDHYGISQTICLGDIGFFLSYKLISESSFPDKDKNKAIQYFSKAMLDTGIGQVLDVALPQLEYVKTEGDILEIFRLKTAHYTLVGPLQLGAILGGADKSLLDNLEKFGENLGIAFQIQDDILGVFGDEKTLGKSVTSDIEEGKNTLLIIHALQNANQQQKDILDKYYGQGKIEVEVLEQIKKVFIDTGTLEYSKQRAYELVEEAKKVIREMEIKEEYRDLLFQMADFLVQRQK